MPWATKKSRFYNAQRFLLATESAIIIPAIWKHHPVGNGITLNTSTAAAVSPVPCSEPTALLKGKSSDAAQHCQRPGSSDEKRESITYKKRSSDKHRKHGLQDM